MSNSKKKSLESLQSASANDRVRALTRLSEAERVGRDELLAVAGLLPNEDIWDPLAGEVIVCNARFSSTVGRMAGILFSHIGDKAIDAVRELIQDIPQLTGSDRTLAMDAICAVGSNSLFAAIGGRQGDEVDIARLLLRVADERGEHKRIVAVAIRTIARLRIDVPDVVRGITSFLSCKEDQDWKGTRGYVSVGDDDLRSPDREARLALASLRPEVVLPCLEDALNCSMDPHHILPVLRELEVVSVPLLVRVLRSSPKRCRLEAADILGGVGSGSAEAVDGLREALERESGWLSRRRIRKALRGITSRP